MSRAHHHHVRGLAQADRPSPGWTMAVSLPAFQHEDGSEWSFREYP